jgi:uncharacterized protein
MTLPSGLTLPMGRIAEICRKYGVKELSVFGSAARGEMRPDSDLDILVEFLPESKIGWEFFELEEELTRVLARKVDLGSKRSLKPWVRADALRDARIIYAA